MKPVYRDDAKKKKRDKWTDAEVKWLQDGYKIHGNEWAKICEFWVCGCFCWW